MKLKSRRILIHKVKFLLCSSEKSTLTVVNCTLVDTTSQHKCPVCRKTFSSAAVLKKHCITHKNVHSICEICLTTFRDELVLKNHKLTCQHVKVAAPAAAREQKGFFNNKAFAGIDAKRPGIQKNEIAKKIKKSPVSERPESNQVFRASGDGIKSVVCGRCPEKFASEEELGKHAQVHLMNICFFMCHLCLECFRSPKNLHLHECKTKQSDKPEDVFDGKVK